MSALLNYYKIYFPMSCFHFLKTLFL